MFRKLAAECFGTFWLVFGGCGSAVLAAAFPELGIGFAGVALAFGLTVLTMAFCGRPYFRGAFQPGGHLRPVGRRPFSGKRGHWLYYRSGGRRNYCRGGAVRGCQR